MFKLRESPVNLLSNGATVNLDFHDLSLVLSELDLADLSSSEDTDDSAILLDAGNVSLDGVLVLGIELVTVSIL